MMSPSDEERIVAMMDSLRNLCGSMASSTSERLPTTGALSTSALGTRDYSSPKRAINAIREILRCAGYEL